MAALDQGFFSTVRELNLADASLRSDNDFADRLNYHYTTIIIVIFTVVISAKQYVGQPLQCWVWAEFNKHWSKYAENYCWVKNTYFLPMNETQVPGGVEYRRKYEINYYQYVPFILALLAMFYALPNMVWKILNFRTGVDIAGIVQGASSIIRKDPADRKKLIAELAKKVRDKVAYQMDDKNRKAYLRGLKSVLSCFSCSSVNSFGSYITFSYLLTKLLFLVNSVVQLVLISWMLSSEYRPFDLNVLIDMVNHKHWRSTGIFPRITHCDFEIRDVGVKRTHTIQCVLMINLFNEKIFAFLWFWSLVMTVANAASLLYWMSYLLPVRQRGFVADYLESNENFSTDRDQRQLERFVNDRLKNDGVFVLRLVASNSGHLVTTELVHELWNTDNPLQPVIQAADGEGGNEKAEAD